MPERAHELELDEFEKLLGEIPSATVNSNTEELGVMINSSKTPKNVSFEGSIERSRPICDQKLDVNKVDQSTIKRVQIMDDNLLNDQLLASVFEDLSVKDSPIMFSPSMPFNGQHPSSLKNVDSPPIIVFPSPQSTNDQQLVNQQLGFCQTIENFPSPVPLAAPGVPGFHLLSNVGAIPVIPNQQRLFFEAPGPIPYLNPPQNRPESHITWRNINIEQEQEQDYHRMQQDVNPVTRLVSQSTCQTCNQEPYGMARRCTNQNQNQPNGMHPSNQTVPEKILTRSHGLNPLASLKFGSFESKDPISSVNHAGRSLLPHDYFNRKAVDFQLDCLNSRGFSPVNHNNLKYNDLGERIYTMAKDQHGCRFLQRKFTEGTREDLDNIFREIIVHVVELMTDPFGNYLVQKLLEACDKDQHMQILHVITRKPGDLVRISCDMHGFALSLQTTR